jgi:ABC-type multidrug transport system ATPase subunit
VSTAARARAIDAAPSNFNLAHTAASVAGELPLGLRQRLALAAALLHGPDIIVSENAY